MPLTPDRRAAYPPNWDDLSRWVRFDRAGGRCECPGDCGRDPSHLEVDGRCGRRHGEMLPGRTTGVVLTTMHLDQDVTHNCPDNLRAGCEACHLSFDRPFRTSRAEAHA
jgi:hypothetical protein